MSEATVTYNGSEIASIDGGESVILATIGKYLTSNITIEAAESFQVEVVPVRITDNFGSTSGIYFLNQFGEFTQGQIEGVDGYLIWSDELCSGSMVVLYSIASTVQNYYSVENLEHVNTVEIPTPMMTQYLHFFKVTGQGAIAGNGRYEVGDITIPSEVLVTATPEPFPGLELDFDPDYIQVWMDKDDFNDIASPSNGRMYLLIGMKYDANLIPQRRVASIFVEDEVSPNGYYFLAGTNVLAMTSPATGYALPNPGYINATAYPGWEIDDGKFYLRRLAAGNQRIPPGTYHYVAYKRGV